MAPLHGYEGPLSWVFLHLLLIVVPAVGLFLAGRRLRIHLWQVATLVLLTALVMLPAVACVHLNSRPEAWLAVMRMHATGSAGVRVMGIPAPGWATMLVALSLGLGLGLMLFRTGRRDHPAKRRPLAASTDA